MESLKFSKLAISNFRNICPDIIEFSTGINCIFGENGNGKTNILEAIYFLANNKSFRKNASFPQFLNINGEETEIIFSSVLQSDTSGPKSYSTRLTLGKSEWFWNSKPCKKKLPIEVVFVNPFDSYSFHNQASARRNWFDHYMSTIDKDFKKLLGLFNATLRFRNKLLSKKPDKYWEQIQAIDPQFIKYSLHLIHKRKEFLKEINPYICEAFKKIFSEEHSLNIQIESKFSDFSSKKIEDYYSEQRERDKILGYTSYGVHKDDYILLFDGLNAFEYCSLGQQKMSFLSLLFAYVELFRYKFNTFPIVLLDDVSGELDRIRWQNLVAYLSHSKFQVLITTANEKFREELEKIGNAKKLYVDAGSIRSI